MVRVKQFADDLGITKNKAKNLINKGRSRKDGGSQILEKMMKPKKYDVGGSNKVTKEDKKKKKKNKNKNKKLSPFSRDGKSRTFELTEDMIGGRGRAPVLKDMDFDPRMMVRRSNGGSNVTKVNKDKLTKAQMGQFKNIVNASTSGKITPAEAEKKIRKMLTIKKKDGGSTDFGMLSVKAGIDNNPKPTQADRIAGATKNMRGGGIAIQGLGFKGVR